MQSLENDLTVSVWILCWTSVYHDLTWPSERSRSPRVQKYSCQEFTCVTSATGNACDEERKIWCMYDVALKGTVQAKKHNHAFCLWLIVQRFFIKFNCTSAGASCVFSLSNLDQVNVRITSNISRWTLTEAAQLYLILHQSCFSLKSDHQDLLRSVCYFISQSALHYMFGSFTSHLTQTDYWRYRATNWYFYDFMSVYAVRISSIDITSIRVSLY